MTYHLFELKTVIAKKQHKCIWCGQSIEPDEAYEREKSVYDGSFQNHNWHPECQEDAQQCWKDGGDQEFTAYSADRPQKETLCQTAI